MDRRVILVEDINAASVKSVGCHVVTNLVSGPAFDRTVHPVGLGGRVIGQLVLVQDRRAILTVPDGVVLLEVLDKQSGRGDVITVDDHAVAAGVGVPAFRVAREALDAMVRPPDPDVIDQDIIAVHLERHIHLADVRPTNAEVHI